jgi:predicted RNase H-like HicB family nuclease
MKQYKLPVVMYEPSDETENKYMAEIPVLPGCRAWGSSPAETLEYLQSVATEFIISYKIHGHDLPTTIPNWGSKDMKLGTISRILKELGISKEDFENA